MTDGKKHGSEELGFVILVSLTVHVLKKHGGKWPELFTLTDSPTIHKALPLTHA